MTLSFCKWWWCSPHHAMIQDCAKHSSLLSSNDVIQKAWISLTFLDEVFISCYCASFADLPDCVQQSCPDLPKESDISSGWCAVDPPPVLVILWSLAISLLSTAAVSKVLSESFKPYDDMCMRYSFIFINSFKHFVCFYSCFMESETKLDVYLVLHNSKYKWNVHARLLHVNWLSQNFLLIPGSCNVK